jgi:hypothetical protein
MAKLIGIYMDRSCVSFPKEMGIAPVSWLLFNVLPVIIRTTSANYTWFPFEEDFQKNQEWIP